MHLIPTISQYNTRVRIFLDFCSTVINVLKFDYEYASLHIMKYKE